MGWGGRRGRSYDWGGWPRYVPVAERRAKAMKQAEKLRKKGDFLAPVVIAGRAIAATFWGKAWCENLERYGDYANRIPRGRAYVRNGSVLDLKIGTARVDALVSGSHLYSVAIEIRPLKSEAWKGLKKACTGGIGSLLELLQGKLSREVMEIVTRPKTGLFPEPADISFRCSCPDWASMCKHVAAVLYGVGARLDREPALLFTLRDVDHQELIAAPGAANLTAAPGTRDRLIAEGDLAEIFDIEIDAEPAGRRLTQVKPKRAKEAGVRAISTKPAAPKRGRRPKPQVVTETPETAKPRRSRPSKQADAAAAPPEPPKRKRGRPRLTPEHEVPAKPRRGRPPLVRKGGSIATPQAPKRKRGRPRLASKAVSPGGAVPLLEEPKRERPRLRPSFIRALREEAARKRSTAAAIHPQKKSFSRKGGAGRDAAPTPIATRKRGRPPKKREV